MKKAFYLTLGLTLLIVTLSAQIVSEFTLGTETWRSEGDGDFYWESDAGNPGGCFRVDDDATGDINYAFAPTKFLGNWSFASAIDDYISADIYLHTTDFDYISNSYVFKIKGPAGEATAVFDVQPPVNEWITYTALLDPAEWSVSGDWDLLLEQITDFIITAEYITGDESVRIDNVILSFSPEIIPVVPVICSDFDNGGYDGWSFENTGNVSNTSFTGLPGKSLKITDGSGTAFAYPPPKYLGDWTQLDNYAAHIILDMNISSHSGSPLNNEYFIRISGPDGSAKFPLDNEILSNAISNWNTFTFPIDENYWEMESGTWIDLLSWVNNMEIAVEFFDGTEVVWLDNFCVSDAPPTAEFSVVNQVDFVGNPIQFLDKSQSGPVSWHWDFGDMQTSNIKNPMNTYQTAGLFDIKLKAGNYFGYDSLVKPDFVEVLPIDQCLKFEDDFNDNDIYPIWHFKNGTWTELNESFRQSSNYYTSNDYLDGCFAITGSPLWENYLLSCDLYSTDNDYIGFVFNWQDEENMYMFLWSRQDESRRLVKWVDGVEIILAEDDIPYISSQWYSVRILSDNGKLVVAIDGDEVFSVYDDTFVSGKAGLYCWANQSTYWDNFKVKCTASETLVVPTGWSGISSYVIPVAENVESIFNPVLSDLTILQNANGIFWPGQNINTLGTWNTHDGYQIKASEAFELTISGARETNKTLQLEAGWNLIPVINECSTDVTELLENSDVELVKEVAGTAVFWPEFEINTLAMLDPGKAYFLLTVNDENITFPDCDGLKHISTKRSVNSKLPGFEITRSPITHTVAIPSNTVQSLELPAAGYLIALDEKGDCYGVAMISGTSASITLFGDELSTIQKDGFIEDEKIMFGFIDSASGEKFDLNITYEDRFDNSGLFRTNGMSVVSRIETTLSEFNHQISFYPNPSNGIFTVEGIEEDASIKIFNAFGEEVKQPEKLSSNCFNIGNQPKGVYFINIESATGNYFEKLIIQ